MVPESPMTSTRSGPPGTSGSTAACAGRGTQTSAASTRLAALVTAVLRPTEVSGLERSARAAGELLAERLQCLVGRERAAVGLALTALGAGGVAGVGRGLAGLDLGLGGLLLLLDVRLPASVRLGV